MSYIINKLAEELIGKTIISVSDGYGEACVCKLGLYDKNKDQESWLQIHANDLGQWVKKSNVVNNVFIINSLGQMFCEFYEFLYEKLDEEYIKSNVKITYDDTFVSFEDLNSKQVFKCYLNHEWEKRVVKHPEFLSLVKEAINCGAFYAVVFADFEDIKVPDEYRYMVSEG